MDKSTKLSAIFFGAAILVLIFAFMFMRCGFWKSDLLKDPTIPNKCKVSLELCRAASQGVDAGCSLSAAKCYKKLDMDDCDKYLEKPLIDHDGKVIMTYQSCLDKLD